MAVHLLQQLRYLLVTFIFLLVVCYLNLVRQQLPAREVRVTLYA